MKNFSILVALLFVLTSAVTANADIRVGIIGGINRTTVDLDEPSGVDVSSRTDWGLGALIEIDMGLNDRLSIQFEPMYLQKGSTADVVGFGTIEVEAEYFEIPVMFKYEITDKKIKPYIMAGPTFGFLLNAEQNANFIPGDQRDITDDTNTVDVGIGIGGGLSYRFEDSHDIESFIQARYNFGLTDVDRDENDTKSRGFHIMFGFTIPLGK